MSVKKILELAVSGKKVAIAWFNNYSGVVVKTPKSVAIFDPVNTKPEDVLNADALIITHEHYDHFDPKTVVKIWKQTNATIVTTPYIAKQLKEVSPVKIKALNVGEEASVGDIILNAEHSSHPANQPLTFVLTTSENIRIYHSSDSKPYPEMREIGKKYSIDIAFCTVGIAPGASPASGVEIAELVKPKVAIPYHTDKPENLKKFAEILVGKTKEVKPRIIKQLEVYQYPE
ncbi:MAG: MBL fold metallo-hydrolase [Candidatus Bathyarchaeota archaeon]